MKPRKIVLLSACAVLLVIAIVQVIGAHKNPVKILSLKEEIDEIRIARPDGNLNLKKKGESWVVGDKEYPAVESECDTLIADFSSIRILDKITKTDNEDVLAKYNLDSINVYTVTVYNAGKLLRTYYVGKTSSTNSQTYMRIDNANDIYLVSGSIQSDCVQTVDDLRSKVVYEVDKDLINTISINSVDDEPWALTRSGDGTVWSVSGVNADGIEIDAEKATSWFQSSSAISCMEWLADDAEVPGDEYLSITIAVSNKNIKFDIYRTVDDDDEVDYWGKCSESPYAFKVALYVVQRFLKSPEDFGK